MKKNSENLAMRTYRLWRLIVNVTHGCAKTSACPNKIKIIADQRETRSGVVRSLDLMPDVEIQLVTLEVADYVLSNRVGIERKDPEDFFNSLFGLEKNKLWGQLFDLKNAYERPILIFEGYYEELFSTRNVNPKAIQGILNSIALMQIPMIFSLNPAGTAEILKSIATKEQSEDKRPFSQHGKRSHMTPSEQLVYSVSSIPDIGNNTAIHLLEEFKSIKNIVNASGAELAEVKLIGKPTALRLISFFEREFKKEGVHP